MMDSRLAKALAAFGLDPARPGSLIAGKILSGTGEDVTIFDPVTGRPFWTYADAGSDIASQAAAAANEAQHGWAQRRAADRGRVMQAISRTILELAEPLAQLESLAAGKPIRDTRVEVTKVAEMFEYYAGWADKFHGEVIPVPSSHLNYTRREPMGVILQITPCRLSTSRCV